MLLIGSAEATCYQTDTVCIELEKYGEPIYLLINMTVIRLIKELATDHLIVKIIISCIPSSVCIWD